MAITIREIDDIDSGLKILGYECDDFLNEKKFRMSSFYQLYFFYSGYIGHLKRINWSRQDIRQTLMKFPALFQPSWIIIVPTLGYISGLWFTASILSLSFFVLIMAGAFYLAFRQIKQQLRKDLIFAIQLTSELRMHLYKMKSEMIQELLA